MLPNIHFPKYDENPGIRLNPDPGTRLPESFERPLSQTGQLRAISERFR
jgi:hypothetical protein